MFLVRRSFLMLLRKAAKKVRFLKAISIPLDLSGHIFPSEFFFRASKKLFLLVARPLPFLPPPLFSARAFFAATLKRIREREIFSRTILYCHEEVNPIISTYLFFYFIYIFFDIDNINVNSAFILNEWIYGFRKV